jgi:hypothetical protein
LEKVDIAVHVDEEAMVKRLFAGDELENGEEIYTPRSRGQADPHDFCAGGELSYCLSSYCAMMPSMEATTGGASWP